MTNRTIDFTGTALDGVPLVVLVAMAIQDNGFRISADGAGDLLIEVQYFDETAYNTIATITDETVNISLENVENIRLTASGSDVDYSIRLKQCRVSTPEANWDYVQPVT